MNSCPICNGPIDETFWDLCVARDGFETLMFGVPASVCLNCNHMILPLLLVRVFGIEGLPISGIETDIVAQQVALDHRRRSQA
jgi:hypothetical protein